MLRKNTREVGKSLKLLLDQFGRSWVGQATLVSVAPFVLPLPLFFRHIRGRDVAEIHRIPPAADACSPQWRSSSNELYSKGQTLAFLAVNLASRAPACSQRLPVPAHARSSG